jgi:aldose sugar dehydrogenase
LVIGSDHYLYAVIGDLNHRGNLQSINNGPDPADTSVILRVNPYDGSAAKNNPFINNANSVMHKYYAYGLRNSFGITFDPVTGNLWQLILDHLVRTEKKITPSVKINNNILVLAASFSC